MSLDPPRYAPRTADDRRLMVLLATLADVAYLLLLVWSAGQLNTLFDGLIDGLSAWLFIGLVALVLIPAVLDFLLLPFEELVDRRRARATRKGTATLLTAAAMNDLDKVQALIRADPKLMDTTDPDGQTALHLATRHVYGELADRLLHRGADVFAKTAEGLTPLDLAVRHGSRWVGRLILSHVRRSLSGTE
ncbi:MAG: ankyrin repeat domain-containing protein [Proteobacteria bacterium]|nr:ankyrin repeat domain-containing protein [Pseudomonadota bacterium]